jgi:hypothetical protein
MPVIGLRRDAAGLSYFDGQAQQGARANDRGCHVSCSEQHEPRQPRSWLILNVRCFRSCPAAHTMRSFREKTERQCCMRGSRDKGLPAAGRRVYSEVRSGVRSLDALAFGLHPAHHVELVRPIACERWLLQRPSAFHHRLGIRSIHLTRRQSQRRDRSRRVLLYETPR